MNEINTWPGWENVEMIGEGSFGKVYRIRREEFGVASEAALKVITIPGSQADLAAAREEGMDDASVTNYFKSFVEDLAAEFALMSSLKGNSNIVSYEDHMVIPREGEVGWDILIRMELLTPLQAAAAQKPLTDRDVAVLGIDMCRALTLCRSRGIIHRDIKPENIFISRDGCYKLGDFGVARVAEKTVSAMSRKGTYSYMAPEVYKSEKYGFAADIYSLGIVLYRYLNNNRLPFLPPYPEPIQYSDRENALARRMGGEELPPPENGSTELKEAVLKACAYRAEKRYDSAESFMADLESALHMMEENQEACGDRAASEPERLAQEKMEEDDFDRTMSAAVLGKAKQAKSEDILPEDNRKDDGHSKDGRKDSDRSKDGRKDDKRSKDGRNDNECSKDERKDDKHSKDGRNDNERSKDERKEARHPKDGRNDNDCPKDDRKDKDLSKYNRKDDVRLKEGRQEEKDMQDAADLRKETLAKKNKTGGRKKMILIAAGVGILAVALVVSGIVLVQKRRDSLEKQAIQRAEDRQWEQAMQEALAMLDTPTEAAELAAHKAAVEAFDGRLMGSWDKDGYTEQLGEQYISNLSGTFDDINILETGEFYLGLKKEWLRLAEEGTALPVMTVKDGTTDIFEAGKGIYDEGGQGAGEIYTLLPSVTDLSVTYELSDYEPEESETYAEFYGNDTMDYLTLHIQGNYQDGPLTVKNIDSLFHYKKNTNLECWFFPGLEGRWTDNNGFVWAFRIARGSVAEPAEEFRLAFAMKDSSGQVHEGKEIFGSYENATGTFTIRIRFQDGITIPGYTLVSYDGMTLELEGNDGSRLVLTRS